MRENKFRIWDTASKTWVSGNSWGINLKGEIVCPTADKTLSLASKQFILIQYTGLKDSQAVEEYYGDIITATLDGGDEWELFVIEDGLSVVLYRNIDTDQIWYFWQMSVSYVIGNIYETDLTK